MITLFAQDVCIACASLVEKLHSALLKAPQQTWKSNGVNMPVGVWILITRADQQTMMSRVNPLGRRIASLVELPV